MAQNDDMSERLSYIRAELTAAQDKKDIIQKYSDISTDDRELSDLIGLYRLHYLSGDASVMLDALAADKRFYRYPEALYFAAAENHDISAAAYDDMFRPEKAVRYCFESFTDAEAVFSRYNDGFGTAAEELYMFARCFEAVVLISAEKGITEHICTSMSVFGAYGGRLAEKLIVPEYLDTEILSPALPAEIRKYIFAERAAECFSEHDYRKALAWTICLLRCAPAFAAAASAYRDGIVMAKQRSDKTVHESELRMLAQTLKERIRSLIGKRRFAEAGELLKEYRSLAPLDPEGDELAALLRASARRYRYK